MGLRQFADLAAVGFEVAGVAVMVLGALAAFVLLFVQKGGVGHGERFRRLRRQLGASILLGLELLIASDIIYTVIEVPSIRAVMMLGLIVLIRTFLSYSLEVELEGSVPWRRSRGAK